MAIYDASSRVPPPNTSAAQASAVAGSSWAQTQYPTPASLLLRIAIVRDILQVAGLSHTSDDARRVCVASTDMFLDHRTRLMNARASLDAITGAPLTQQTSADVNAALQRVAVATKDYNLAAVRALNATSSAVAVAAWPLTQDMQHRDMQAASTAATTTANPRRSSGFSSHQQEQQFRSAMDRCQVHHLPSHHYE